MSAIKLQARVHAISANNSIRSDYRDDIRRELDAPQVENIKAVVVHMATAAARLKAAERPPSEKYKVRKFRCLRLPEVEVEFLNKSRAFADFTKYEMRLGSSGEIISFTESEKRRREHDRSAEIEALWLDEKRHKPPEWNRLSEPTRFVEACRAMIERHQGNVYAFSLRIDPDILAELENVVDCIRRRIRDSLKNYLGRPVETAFAFHIHNREGDELHVHGVVPLSPNEIPSASLAFHKAGGDWREGPGKGRQLHLRPVWEIDGWSSYCLGEADGVRAHLQARRKALGVAATRAPRVTSISDKLLIVAQARHETLRREMKRLPKERLAYIAEIKAA
ncbi:hypothetical protein LG047_07770 [Methylocystis sp. WRRC1]|uniref:hypothetical protein n=1 Tax=Methylocystis sp. WRRC1 TaxID=1732014 RepID=UPI001D138267|nr:hypothetical protein [Methylocystis sp. WRRC1]MCC3245217.1 hypothetical protein [Methylocystis sp. WRRC1]